MTTDIGPRRSLATALAAGALLWLAGPALAASDAPPSLAGSEWEALTVEGEPVPDGVEVFIQFGAEGRAAGSSGCNRFTGGYTQEGERFAMPNAASTRMACPPPRMEVEQRFFAALASADRLSRPEPNRLVLYAGAQTVMTLRRRDAD